MVRRGRGGSSGAGIVVIAQRYFDIPFVYGVLAVLLAFILALVACRATGESDITPTGAMGKIMQLTYGVLMPQKPTPNLMTAGITAGASSASADLLTDLKSGYLLGANPRRQFVAQILGIVPGTIATVLGYFILVPSVTALTGENGRDPAFPAPAAQSWAAVAKVFAQGPANLHPMAQSGILYGLVAGAALVLLRAAPCPKHKKYLPSATGLGLGLLLPFLPVVRHVPRRGDRRDCVVAEGQPRRGPGRPRGVGADRGREHRRRRGRRAQQLRPEVGGPLVVPAPSTPAGPRGTRPDGAEGADGRVSRSRGATWRGR